jgi:hypothetical protein
MPLDLELQLKQLCQDHNPPLGLYKRLERVRDSSISIWKEPRLKWFTDHSAETHSRKIIEHIGEIIGPLQNSAQRLNPHELFVLLAACYLHDIGMQDFRSAGGKGVENFTIEDYIDIRENHPQRARELIIERTLKRERDDFKIDLDDDPQYLVPIALVSQSHGSKFFLNTVKELQHLGQRPGNAPFRGDLLAALLLMGDELDLHENRAIFPKEFAHSPQSLLHNLIHNYVTSVEICDGKTPKHRRIRLMIQYPSDADEYCSDVLDWIVSKLRKQSELTKRIFEESTKGELNWDERIEIHESVDNYHVRRSFFDSETGKEALNILKLEVLQNQTIDRDEFLKIYRNSMQQSVQHFQGIQIIHQKQSDLSHILKLLSSICQCYKGNTIHIAFHHPTGHGPFDILTRITDDLKANGFLLSEYSNEKISVDEHQADSLRRLEHAIVNDIKTENNQFPLILLFEDINLAEQETITLLESFISQMIEEDSKILVILTKFDEAVFNPFSGDFPIIRLDPFTQSHIGDFLQKRYGYSSENAMSKSGEISNYTLGMPIRVYTGLKAEESSKYLIIKG